MESGDFLSDFDYRLNDYRLKKATLVGVWKQNSIRRMIYHHKTDTKFFNLKKSFKWVDD